MITRDEIAVVHAAAALSTSLGKRPSVRGVIAAIKAINGRALRVETVAKILRAGNAWETLLSTTGNTAETLEAKKTPPAPKSVSRETVDAGPETVLSTTGNTEPEAGNAYASAPADHNRVYIAPPLSTERATPPDSAASNVVPMEYHRTTVAFPEHLEAIAEQFAAFCGTFSPAGKLRDRATSSARFNAHTLLLEFGELAFLEAVSVTMERGSQLHGKPVQYARGVARNYNPQTSLLASGTKARRFTPATPTALGSGAIATESLRPDESDVERFETWLYGGDAALQTFDREREAHQA